MRTIKFVLRIKGHKGCCRSIIIPIIINIRITLDNHNIYIYNRQNLGQFRGLVRQKHMIAIKKSTLPNTFFLLTVVFGQKLLKALECYGRLMRPPRN